MFSRPDGARCWCYCVFVLLSALFLGGAGCSRGRAEMASRPPSAAPADEAVAVAVWPVRSGRVEERVETVGNLAPLKRTILYAEVDGVVAEVARAPKPLDIVVDGKLVHYPLNIDIGVPVRRGDVLVRLDPKPFQLAVQQAEKQLLMARRELDRLLAWRRPEEIRQLRARVDAAKARLELEQGTLARYRRLRERGAVSEDELQRQETQVRLARAELEMAQAALEVAQRGPTPAEVAVARAAVERAEAALAVARDRLERSVVRAPYDGVITEAFVSEGERVTATPRTELLELIYVDVLVAQVAVPEKYYGLIRPQDEVELYVANRSEPIRGIVAFVNGKVDYQTRTFRVRIGVDNRKRLLQPGQFVRARFAIRSSEDRPFVPVAAIRYFEGDPHVFVVEDGRARVRRIKLGLSNETYAEVLSGLSPGDLVVTEHVDLLSDGMKVQIREDGEATTAAEVGR